MSFHEVRTYFLGPEEGEALWTLGALYTFKAMGKDNHDEYTLVEVKGPKGFVIPMHLHERENEGFYVAEGQVSLFIGNRTIEARAGSFAFAPRGTEHAFRLDRAETRLVLLITPGNAGHEEMFKEMGEPAQSRTIPPPPEAPPDPEQLTAVAASHGTRIVGPPPG